MSRWCHAVKLNCQMIFFSHGPPVNIAFLIPWFYLHCLLVQHDLPLFVLWLLFCPDHCRLAKSILWLNEFMCCLLKHRFQCISGVVCKVYKLFLFFCHYSPTWFHAIDHEVSDGTSYFLIFDRDKTITVIRTITTRFQCQHHVFCRVVCCLVNALNTS